MNKRLGIYCRVSTDMQVKKGFSLKAQEKAGIAKAKELGLKYELFIEAGKSATFGSLLTMPELKRLLAQCNKKKITAIFITEIDRIIRNDNMKYFIVSTLMKNKVELHTNSGLYDWDSATDRLVFNILSSIAQYEVELKAERTERVMEDAVKRGRFQGKLTPYGYTKDENRCLAVDQEEKRIYQQMVEWSLSGLGTNSIAQELNEQGVPTKSKKLYENGYHKPARYDGRRIHVSNDEIVWNAGSVLSILKNPIHKGDRVYKGKVYNNIEPIITTELWQKLQDNLQKNKNNSRRNNTAHFYLLKGFIRCKKCGNNMYGRTRVNKKDHYYMCSSKRLKGGSCGTRSINIDKLDFVVWDALLNNTGLYKKAVEAIRDKDFKEETLEIKKGIKYYKNQLEDLRLRESRLIGLFETGVITDSNELNQRITELKNIVDEYDQKKKQLNDKLKFITSRKDIEIIIEQFEEYMSKVNYTTPKIKQWEIIREFVKQIIISYSEEKKTHTVEIELIIPYSGKATITEEIHRKDTYPNFNKSWKPEEFNDSNSINVTPYGNDTTSDIV